MQMVTFSYKFDLPYVLKSERILFGDYTVLNVVGSVVDKKIVAVLDV